MQSPFRNPYYRAAAILARLVVNLASAVWAIAVLLKTDAIASTSYAAAGRVLNEDMIAWGLLAIATVQAIWLFCHFRPLQLGALGYAAMTGWWMFILGSIAFSESTPPEAWGGVSAVVAVAIFGFIANPVRGSDDAPAG